MGPADIVILLVIVFILGLAGGYVYKARKKGVKCIGCPDAKTCSGNCAGCSGACAHKKEQ